MAQIAKQFFLEPLAYVSPILSCKNIFIKNYALSNYASIQNRRYPILKSIKTEKALAHAFKHSKDMKQFVRQMQTWFDAFRTLKLIHSLRDLGFTSISLARLAEHKTYQDLLSFEPELLVFHTHLNQELSTNQVPPN